MNKKPDNFHRGIMLPEITVGLAVLGLLAAGIYLSTRTFKGINHYHHARQQCLAAGQAQLDSLVCRGTLLPKEQSEKLWPGVTVTVEKSAGTGPWQGLRRVCVITRCINDVGKKIEVRQSRYLHAPPGSNSIKVDSEIIKNTI